MRNTSASQSALKYFYDTLRLCHGRYEYGAQMTPCILLRLRRDQECYDFLKWYNTTALEKNYDWCKPESPYLDIHNADAFEHLIVYEVHHVVALTLIKARICHSIGMLQAYKMAHGPFIAAGFGNIPSLDNFRKLLLSPIVAASQETIGKSDHTADMKTLMAQIEELYYVVRHKNQHFWDILLDPTEHLEVKVDRLDRPRAFANGSLEQAQEILQHCYDAWIDIPGRTGPIDVIKAIKNGPNPNALSELEILPCRVS